MRQNVTEWAETDLSDKITCLQRRVLRKIALVKDTRALDVHHLLYIPPLCIVPRTGKKKRLKNMTVSGGCKFQTFRCIWPIGGCYQTEAYILSSRITYTVASGPSCPVSYWHASSKYFFKRSLLSSPKHIFPPFYFFSNKVYPSHRLGDKPSGCSLPLGLSET